MEVTDILIRNMNNTGKLKAIVSCTFDQAFVVHDIKVIESQNGLFIAMPSRKSPNGNYIDIAHPIHAEFRQYLSELILNRYRTEKGKNDGENQADSGSDKPVHADDAASPERSASLKAVSSETPRFSDFSGSEETAAD